MRKRGLIPLILLIPGALSGPLAAQDRPVVAMIGTGTLAGTFGPALGRAGYQVVYGSRDPARESVRTLVERTGQNASATTQREAAARARIVVLAVPAEVVEEVAGNLGLDGKIVLDVSGGSKRVAADGYLELVSDSTHAERIQARHPAVQVVRINLPSIAFFLDPMLVGTPPSVLIAGNSPRAREAVARVIFDLGLDPHDAGPLRFSRVFDALGVMSLIPAQQGRVEGYDLKLLPSTPWSCFFDPAQALGFGRPYDRDSLPKFPRRDAPMPCEEWRRRVEERMR
jgi:predicted dinucleotide-binding enzyme